MSNASLNLTTEVYNYLRQHALREPPILEKLRSETASISGHQMQISPEQGQFMRLLMEITGAKKTLDIGTFTGYSALSVALALPDDGKVITCDVDPKIAQIAQRYFHDADVQHKITVALGPATETLQNLIDNNQQATFDFAFIDADKNGYDAYYEKCLVLLRQGGLIAIDNVLWDGAVVDPANQESTTVSIRKLNAKILADERVSISMLPIGDGLTLARKR